ncbi:glycosyltransferase [Maribacter sp.]|uniref:glycosyltransferase n=1 Tax=Maribacter sp. TaxID=1897614 RepID=UPI003297A04D
MINDSMAYKKLIYDTVITGHHSEYIGHLIDSLYDRPGEEGKYIFVVHPKFASLFPEIYDKGEQCDHINWVAIEENELKSIQNGNFIIRSIRSMDIMSSYAKKFDVSSVVALDFHIIKYGAIYKSIPFTLSSILFLQFYRLKKKTFKQKIEFYKRYYVTKLVSRNSSIKNIFVLNDQDTVDYMNMEFNTDCFKMLPDPIPKLKPLNNFDIYGHYNIERHRKIYLHIGTLGERKGTEEVINSAYHVPSSEQHNIAILLVGRVGDKNDLVRYKDTVEQVDSATNVQMVWDNKFIDFQMMKSIFDQCHAVLLPYKNAEFSSGILGHAAAANKIVIATNEGLLRELVIKYKLGELLEDNNALNLALKMVEVIDKQIITVGHQQFVRNHDPMMFSKLLLSK